MYFDPATLSSNLCLIDEMYQRFQEAPETVDGSWRQLFTNGQYVPPVQFVRPAGLSESRDEHPGALWPLVNAYRVRGHLAAQIDPLRLMDRPGTVELDPANYGFNQADLDREFRVDSLHGMSHATLRAILANLREIYCGSIGLEFMHISTPSRKRWLAEHMENSALRPKVDAARRKRMLSQVVAAETLERFFHVKYPGTKRFSLEGSEGLVPVLDLVLEHGTRLGAIEAVLGMAHRGRINALVQIMGRKPRDLFAEFEDIEPESTLGGGDVKYHLGYSSDRTDAFGNVMHLSLAFNPSHLEAVDPVVVGRVRAKQRRHVDWEHRRVLGVLVHGDAAFAGQGLVAETLNLTNLRGFRTGGTVHIIVNNQIGFTATPQEARSTPYPTDVAKMIQCPIFHVNGEDLDAVAQVVELAMEYRARFQADVIIDMLCYRKFGHNEMDEPSFTQPVMYRRIQEKQSIVDLYAQRLLRENVIVAEAVSDMRRQQRAKLDRELEIARASEKRPKVEAMHGVWSNFLGGPDDSVPDVETGTSRERLHQITDRVTTIPEDIRVHRKIRQLFAQREKMGQGEQAVDWGMAEMLAYGSLLWEGHSVRLTGQDSARGTFSHRHAVITDIETGDEYMPLSSLHADQGACRIYDSPVTEGAVLGFEFGYSLDTPDGLVIWEAQFGDFANGAQVLIDQFIVAAEDKWNRLSGLTLYLPHGYEGMGPEHSSARMERFLQLAAEDCIQVCQPTTPAQMFHLIRRQLLRRWRKPLIVLTPKSLLRHPAATSPLEEFIDGRFQRVLPDCSSPPPAGVRRVFLCSGRIYFDLVDERARRNATNTAIIRVEQLYPWSSRCLSDKVEYYASARELVWVQDEPANMGAAHFVAPRLAETFPEHTIRYVSRAESASPATGSSKAHNLEHKQLMDQAFHG